MAEYGIPIEKAVGAVTYEDGVRKRVFGMDMVLVSRLWPVIAARHGVERNGPTSEQDAYIRAANAKKDQLERDYRIVG